ncbi:HD domain-containing protein [Peribacillus sp. SCS-26]|uniref:HD domain-containing protein n=1 Tax=Paraperibacillus marinus TaxID=3115295 RepID=UPI0039067435
MKLADPLYGEFEIEGVLLDLLETAAIKRLKNIHQGGASYLVNRNWNVTRYEHSVGVMLLLKRMGASLEEQIAGLIHDVSHTAFSHVVDHMTGNLEQNYHETIFEEVVKTSEIPAVLSRHGYRMEGILPADRWLLLERELPDLCADRIDYTLRDLTAYGSITMDEARQFIADLEVVDKKLCVGSLDAGDWFAEAYYKEVIDFFLDPGNVYGYALLADILKIGIEKKILSMEDIKKDDEYILNLLYSSSDREIKGMLEGFSRRAVSDDRNYDIHVKKKIRIIDPLIRYKGRLVRGSELSSNIRQMNRKAVERSTKGTYIRLI